MLKDWVLFGVKNIYESYCGIAFWTTGLNIPNPPLPIKTVKHSRVRLPIIRDGVEEEYFNIEEKNISYN